MINNNDGKILNFPGATKTPVLQPQTVQVTPPPQPKAQFLSPFEKRCKELRPKFIAQYG